MTSRLALGMLGAPTGACPWEGTVSRSVPRTASAWTWLRRACTGRLGASCPTTSSHSSAAASEGTRYKPLF